MRLSLTVSIAAGVLAAIALLSACSSGTSQGSNSTLPSSDIIKVIGHPNGPLSATIKEFALPHSGSQPFGITLGPDGNLWFTELAGNRIGRITLAGTITEYSLPRSGSSAVSIAAGSDGNLWFTEFYGNAIGQINSKTHTITEFSSGLSPNSGPNFITPGRPGNLLFTEAGEYPYGIKIGMITTSGKITKQYSIPTAYNSNPEGIVLGWDNKAWIAEANAGNAIVSSTASGNMTVFRSGLSFGAYPQGIAAGPDGNLWFTESGSTARIGRITVTGTITEFSSGISQCGCNYNLYGITPGPDGNLWFTETATNKIGQITTAGQVTEYSGLSASSGPQGITAGPQGTLWFTEDAGNRIGRLTLPPV
jgi:streptogramin lyase